MPREVTNYELLNYVTILALLKVLKLYLYAFLKENISENYKVTNCKVWERYFRLWICEGYELWGILVIDCVIATILCGIERTKQQ